MANESDHYWFGGYLPPDPYYNAQEYKSPTTSISQGYPSPYFQSQPHFIQYNSPYAPPHNFVSPSSIMRNPPVASDLPSQVQSHLTTSSVLPPKPSATLQTGQSQNPIRIGSNTSKTIPAPIQRLDDTHDSKRRCIETQAPVQQSMLPASGNSSVLNFTPQGVSKQFPIEAGVSRLGNRPLNSFTLRDTLDKGYLENRLDIASLIEESNAAEKFTYNPKTIARDVLIAAGRHPTEKALNHHLFRLRNVFPHLDISSDLETFRWDLVDQASDPKARDSVQTRAFASGFRAAVPSSPAPLPYLPVNNSTPRQQPLSVPVTPEPQQIQQQSTPTQQPLLVPPPQPQLQPHPQSQPPSQSKPQSQPQLQPQSQPQTQPQTQPQPQRKVATPRVQIPSMKMLGKRPPGRPPGRPPANSKVEVAISAPPISYPVYTCYWKDCQAELHNLDMLKKHIYKVHVSFNITCLWKDCSLSENMPAASLYKHVKKEHVEPIAWKLGDGPRVPEPGGGSTSQCPCFATLSESKQPQSEDSLIFPASYSSIRAFNRVHGNHTQYEKAREILKAVQRLKEQIGVGLDPGGCQLATPARNERISRQKDVYEVISES
ncbi:putative C2H2 finger domain protein [Aspergillus tanneri]|uniref:C2H2-type domain-containing protein n=1 Tax=Aspergillus tanneri TaxID=1220188 RepID=A0A5M9N2T6_9EURO|nr:uncharacterized protein ATNIH1004_000200 [Aspergillus tanneri]KAA8651319.1 hypothetical protein ATNIH1004_000200 [Aspergillus tanneri]